MNIPSFADLDGDGDLDVFIGDWNGTILYMRNTGNATSPAFTPQSGSLNPFDGAHVGVFSIPASPTWMGTATWMPLLVNSLAHPLLREYRQRHQPGFHPSRWQPQPPQQSGCGDIQPPSFADLDGDGDLDAYIGDYYGTVAFFENFGMPNHCYLPIALR